MTVITDIHTWNIHCCFILGIWFNFALLWLIIKKSPKEMQFYSRILLQTAITDMVMATFTELMQPVVFAYKKDAIFYLDGPFARALPYTMAQFLLEILHMMTINFSIFGQAIQFLYRYLALNRGVKISVAAYLSMLLVIPVILIFLALLFVIEGYPCDNKRFMEDEGIAELITGSHAHHPLLAIRADTTKLALSINAAVFNLANIICYAIIIVCGVKMVKFVRKNAITSKKQEMDRQLTRTLILMAIAPLLSLCFNFVISISIMMFSKFLSIENSAQLDHLIVSIQIGLVMPINWICVLNPLIVIWTIKPYRKTVIDVFRKIKIQPATRFGQITLF